MPFPILTTFELCVFGECLGLAAGTLTALDAAAEARIHDDPATRTAWLEARNANTWLDLDDGCDDRFGFKADQRKHCQAVVNAVRARIGSTPRAGR